uniref:B30.2/SPRY domain-containing protein n=1 Tax=Syphacia muris TaxID=451379 RepID=A0A0N5AP96_9BILA
MQNQQLIQETVRGNNSLEQVSGHSAPEYFNQALCMPNGFCNRHILADCDQDCGKYFEALDLIDTAILWLVTILINGSRFNFTVFSSLMATATVLVQGISVAVNNYFSNVLKYAVSFQGSPFDDFWRPERLEKFWFLPIPTRELMEANTWNPEDCSNNIYVGSDKFTMHRLPVAQSTDAIRGKVGFSKGFHVWEIIWPVKRRGTHAVIGVGTKNANLHSCGYVSLVGSDEESYGWDIVHQACFHGPNVTPWVYPTKPPKESQHPANAKIPDRILCMLDMDHGYLAFSSLQHYYGVAFTGLKGKTLFPMVSSVWGHCEIKLVYMGSLPRKFLVSVIAEPRSLKDISRGEVRAVLEKSQLAELSAYELPREVVKYLWHS